MTDETSDVEHGSILAAGAATNPCFRNSTTEEAKTKTIMSNLLGFLGSAPSEDDIPRVERLRLEIINGEL